MWVKRAHKGPCNLPDATIKDCSRGDLWKCDWCGKVWRVDTFYPENNPTKAGFAPVTTRG